jgi:hypothetical protein
MPVKYNVVQRGNPQKRDEPKKRYVQVNSDGDVGFKELGKKISQLCSVCYGNYAGTLKIILEI